MLVQIPVIEATTHIENSVNTISIYLIYTEKLCFNFDFLPTHPQYFE